MSEGDIQFETPEDVELQKELQTKIDGTNHLLLRLLEAKANEGETTSVAWEFEVKVRFTSLSLLETDTRNSRFCSIGKAFSGKFSRLDEEIANILENAVKTDTQQVDHRFRPSYSPDKDAAVTFHVDARMMCDMDSGHKYVLRR